MTDDLFATPGTRPLWLVTLADLALLLVGFLVLVQATANREAMARSLRARFGGSPEVQMPVAGNAATFSPNSAELPGAAPLVAWARAALADPRISLTVTGSAAPDEAASLLLATDRARAVAAALLEAGLPPSRVALATTRAAGRRATLTIAFTGEHRSAP